ncbi:MAG: hypothetical protein Q3962_09120 [Corynebacterium sp.]|nr:hypothetical protein [Corynebacterium sp.]
MMKKLSKYERLGTLLMGLAIGFLLYRAADYVICSLYFTSVPKIVKTSIALFGFAVGIGYCREIMDLIKTKVRDQHPPHMRNLAAKK